MDETIKPKVEYSEFRRMLEEMRGNKQNSSQDTNNELTNNIRQLVIATKELAKNISKIISTQRASPMGKPRAAGLLQNSNNPKIQSDEDQTETNKREEEQTELLRIIARNTGGDKKFKPEKPPQEEGLNFGGLGMFAVAAGAIAGLAMAWVKTVKFFMTAFGKGIQILGETFPVITKVITTIKTAVTGFLQPLITGFQALASSGGFIGKSIQFIQKAIGGFVEFFAGLGSKLGMFGKIFGAVSKVVSKIAYPLMIILTLWDTVKGALKGWEEGGLVGAIGGAIKGFFNSLIFGVLDMFKGAISWIAGALGFKQVEEFLDSFSFEDMFSSFVDAVLFIPQQIQNFIMHPIESLKKLGTIISDTFSKIVGVFDPVIEFFSGIGKSVVGMLEGIGIPEIGFTIPIIGKKVSIGPFYPFKSDSQKPVAPAETPAPEAADSGSDPGRTDASSSPASQPAGRTTKTESWIEIAGEKVVPGKPLSGKQMAIIGMSTSMGNKYPPEIMEQYNKQLGRKSETAAGEAASPIVEKAATPIPGGGQTVDPSAQNYNAKAAGTETKAPPPNALSAIIAGGAKLFGVDLEAAQGGKVGPNWAAALKDYDSSTPADHLKRQYPGVDKKFIELAKKNPPSMDDMQSIEIHEKMLVTKALGEMERGKDKASPIVPKTATPIPGGGQITDPNAQNYNANYAEFRREMDGETPQPKAPEKATPIAEGGKKPPPNALSAIIAGGAKLFGVDLEAVQGAPTPAGTGNAIESKTGDVADSRDSLSAKGGTGTAIVNAPTTVNNTSQTASFAKSPFRNEEGTLNKYYSTRLGAY